MTNDSTNKILLIGGLAAIAYYFINDKKLPPSPIPLQTEQLLDGPDDVPPPVTPAGDGYPLQYGVYHPDIKLLQAKLGVTADGIIGPQTLHAFFVWRNGDQADIDEYTAEDVPEQFPDRKSLMAYVNSNGLQGNKTRQTQTLQ